MEPAVTIVVAALGLTLVLLVLGILWVPIGGLICGLIARKRGLDVKPWVYIGAVSSALLFVPWFYAVARVSGLRVSRFLTTAAYAALYSAWLAGPIGFMLVVVIAYPLMVKLQEGHDIDYIKYPVFFMVWIVLAIVNLWTWFNSQRALRRSHRTGTPELDGAYLKPWILVITWYVVIFVFYVIGMMIESNDFNN